ncbi:MAG: DUF1614 domain-containing protein [Patescibacteria group bacterium]
MIFIPTILITFLGFLFLLPILFFMGYFKIITLGFESLGISPETTTILLFMILVGSYINIPITKRQLFYREKRGFLNLFKKPVLSVHCIAINVGGAVIPILLSLWFLFKAYNQGIALKPIFISIALMSLILKYMSRVIPGKGIMVPTLAPPFWAAFFALVFVPKSASMAAFVIGTLGTLIGADLLNLKKIERLSPGFLSIGGAGVFDGIFLIGIVSALLS